MSPLERWANGIIGGFIGGGAAAVTSGPIAAMIAPQVFNTGTGLSHLFELMGALFVVNGLFGAMLYLKQHPTPEWDGTDRRGTTDHQTNAAAAGGNGGTK